MTMPKMLQILSAVIYLVVAVAAAPATPAAVTALAAPLAATHQYLLLPPQTQYRLQPALKLQQPLLQPLTPLGRIETPKEQLYVLYPNSPIAQYPLLLRQDTGNPDFWTVVQNWFQNLGGSLQPESPDSGEKPAEEEKNAELLPGKILSPSQPLKMGQRYYIISGQPQFYGNFDAFQNPLGPIVSLQPLQAIKARSAEGSIQAEPEPEQEIKAAAPAEATQEIQQQPIELENPIPLEAAAELPQLKNVPIQVDPEQGIINRDQDPSVVAVRQQLARFITDGKSQLQGNAENLLSAGIGGVALKTKEQTSDDESSIAQAKPSAISVSGRGGVSSSSPIATALVGDNGLALASPSATAVSGEFESDEDEEKKKLKVN